MTKVEQYEDLRTQIDKVTQQMAEIRAERLEFTIGDVCPIDADRVVFSLMEVK